MKQLAVLGLVLLLASGCFRGANDDDDETISSIDDWCSVIGDVDVRFKETDESSDPLAEKQVAYAGIRERIDRLTDASDVVDASVRDDVVGALTLAGEIASAFVSASSFEDASARFDRIITREGAEDRFAKAEPWIKDTCGVDIND